MPLDSGGDTLQVGGLCGVPGRGTQESGEGPGAAWDGESSPESSTFSGDEEEKGEGLEVKPRLLEPGGGKGAASSRPHSYGVLSILPQATPMLRMVRPHSMSCPPQQALSISTDAPPIHYCHPTPTKATPSSQLRPFRLWPRPPSL